MSDVDVRMVGVNRLRGHAMNSNAMNEVMFGKLVGHIEKSGRYPPLIVREIEEGEYEVLDGHHRLRALKELGYEEVGCVVWDVDDEEALVLLTTLNRLEGVDDPRRRGALIGELHEKYGWSVGKLVRNLPDGGDDVEKLLELRRDLPRGCGGKGLGEMKMAVYFFLLPAEKKRLDEVIGKFGGRREEVLMKMVASVETEVD